MCTLVFLVSSKRFCFQSSLVMVEKHYFLQVFKVFGSCFQSPLFLMLAFPFVGFVFVCFLLYFFLLFDKSSCCVLVFVSVVLGFIGYVMCYLLVWGFVFGLVLFGGFRDQVRWPKGTPHLALNTPYLFSFVFGLFFCLFCSLLAFVSSSVLLLVFWKGFRVR